MKATCMKMTIHNKMHMFHDSGVKRWTNWTSPALQGILQLLFIIGEPILVNLWSINMRYRPFFNEIVHQAISIYSAD